MKGFLWRFLIPKRIIIVITIFITVFSYCSWAGVCYYRIKKGESLYLISRKTGYPVSKIIKLNKKRLKNPNRIYPGMKIKLPCGIVHKLENLCTYEVKRGETLYSISKKLKMDPELLIKINRRIYGNKINRLKPKDKIAVLCENLVDWEISRRIKDSELEGVVKSRAKIRGRVFIAPVRSARVRKIKHRLDFSIIKGEKIKAVDKGKVIYFNPSINGLSSMVIIRHHGGYYSIYSGYNIAWFVKKGRRVKRSETIGEAINNTVLRFEMRYRGRKLDLRKFIKRY